MSFLPSSCKTLQHRSQSTIALIDYFSTQSKGQSCLLAFPTMNQYYQSTIVSIYNFLTQSKGESFLIPFPTISQFCQSMNVLTNFLLPLPTINQFYQWIIVSMTTLWLDIRGILPLPTTNQFCQSTIVLINYFLTWSKGESFLLPFPTSTSSVNQCLHQLTTSQLDQKGIVFSHLSQQSTKIKSINDCVNQQLCYSICQQFISVYFLSSHYNQ